MCLISTLFYKKLLKIKQTIAVLLSNIVLLSCLLALSVLKRYRTVSVGVYKKATVLSRESSPLH